MTDNSRPTRAEITDVGQAVYDYNDCTMLSGETGNGKFPVESVQIMGNICRHTEENMSYKNRFNSQWKNQNSQASKLVDLAY